MHPADAPSRTGTAGVPDVSPPLRDVGLSTELAEGTPTSRLPNSSLKDNSFPAPAFYLSETTPLSLHFGEPKAPHFFP